MTKAKRDKLIDAAKKKSRKAKNMDIIAQAFKRMNKGQYKKIVTQEVLDALAEEGVDIS